MPGKKGTGLQNLNAMKYPWRVLWRRGAFPEKYAWMRNPIAAFGDGLVMDKGGPDTITAGERALVEVAQLAKAATMMIMHEAAEHGFIAVDAEQKRWDLQPGAKELAKFLNTLRQAVTDLGTERRAKDLDREFVIRRWSDDPTPTNGEQGGGQ